MDISDLSTPVAHLSWKATHSVTTANSLIDFVFHYTGVEIHGQR